MSFSVSVDFALDGEDRHRRREANRDEGGLQRVEHF
jgi:hypothetical protein